MHVKVVAFWPIRRTTDAKLGQKVKYNEANMYKVQYFCQAICIHVMLIVCARALLRKLVKQVRDNRYIDSFNLLPAKPFALSLSLFFFFES